MAFIPHIIQEFCDNARRTPFGNIYDQNFGPALESSLLQPMAALLHSPVRAGYLRPWRYCPERDSGVSTLDVSDKEFRVNVDVQQFKPDELKITVVDGYVVIEAKHEERSDEHGFISRQFTRKYKIPEDIDQAALVSNLSSDGVLSIQAPKMIKPEESREIPIVKTNQPALKIFEKPDSRSNEDKASTSQEHKQTKDS